MYTSHPRVDICIKRKQINDDWIALAPVFASLRAGRLVNAMFPLV